MKNTYLITSLLLLLVGCSGSEFTASSKKGSITGDPVQTFEVTSCAARTVNKPAVDLLYLVDNSSSINYLNESLRDGIAASMASLNNDFDYRAIVAPLIAEPSESNLSSFLKFASDGAYADLSDDVYTAYEMASVYQPFTQLVGGSSELGLKRAYQVVNANKSFYRKGSYLQIVVISNGDDNEAVYSGGYLDINATNAKVQQRINNLKTFTRKYYDTLPSGSEKNNALRSEEMRFFTVVPHSNCGTGFLNATRYRDASRQLYNYVTGSSIPYGSIIDSLNICGGDYANLLTQISGNIQPVIVPHVYNWWPIATVNTFDENNITVRKSNGTTCARNDLSNGFRYDGQYRVNQETRETPAPPSGQFAEPYTGYLVELFGSCKVTWPECLFIELQNPPVFYGYLDLAVSYTPDVSSIAIQVNGAVVPQDATNGWSYIGSFTGNVLIKAPGDFVSSPPEQSLQSGPHFVRFNGNSAPSRHDDIQWNVDPVQ